MLFKAFREIGGTLRNPEERKVMSPAMVGILITYKTRVALKVIVSNGKEPLLDR